MDAISFFKGLGLCLAFAAAVIAILLIWWWIKKIRSSRVNSKTDQVDPTEQFAVAKANMLAEIKKRLDAGEENPVVGASFFGGSPGFTKEAYEQAFHELYKHYDFVPDGGCRWRLKNVFAVQLKPIEEYVGAKAKMFAEIKKRLAAGKENPVVFPDFFKEDSEFIEEEYEQAFHEFYEMWDFLPGLGARMRLKGKFFNPPKDWESCASSDF